MRPVLPTLLLRALSALPRGKGLRDRVLRNAKWQLAQVQPASTPYLNLGCGSYAQPGFVNLDWAYNPGVNVVWDVLQGVPFADGTFRGIFSEHCLEHFSLTDARKLLKECRRVLAPGGIFRVSVPDAQLYFDLYQRRQRGEAVRFPYESAEPGGNAGFSPEASPVFLVHQALTGYGHQFAYDERILRELLQEAGFTSVTRVAFREGEEKALLLDQEWRRAESLYVEAK